MFSLFKHKAELRQKEAEKEEERKEWVQKNRSIVKR